MALRWRAAIGRGMGRSRIAKPRFGPGLTVWAAFRVVRATLDRPAASALALPGSQLAEEALAHFTPAGALGLSERPTVEDAGF